ncbi:hypothetical protein A4A49_19951 [Nicotiana attenuata]|uniref:Uncharacterized protein n=1 Tax=Nicotiana attenuata TaxID=49451 RepID=A0A1J6IPA1_NICAT|nr:hypothetical protein A4A49_19951 [Nicotiana attenuata]
MPWNPAEITPKRRSSLAGSPATSKSAFAFTHHHHSKHHSVTRFVGNTTCTSHVLKVNWAESKQKCFLFPPCNSEFLGFNFEVRSRSPALVSDPITVRSVVLPTFLWIAGH